MGREGEVDSGGGNGSTFETLAAELIELFGRGVDSDLSEDAFNDLALRVFRYQCRENPVYGALVRGRGIEPDEVGNWRDCPPVPVSVFKHLPLMSGNPAAAECVFRTSGTTGGGGGRVRGTHHVRSLELYRRALIPGFVANVLSDGARLPCVALLPSARQAPDSSLSYMIEVVQSALAEPGGGWFLDPDQGLRFRELCRALESSAARSEPVLIVGTAFALVHFVDAAADQGWSITLPEGSRLMETGGYKGRSRVVSADDLHAAILGTCGIPADRIVNEYGMTEMLSQFYRSPLRDGPGTVAHAPPPWVRTRVLDPVTLVEVDDGPGLLCHFDLANLGTVSTILTEDLGVATGGGFVLLGRAEGAEPRGCSLAAEEILEVADRAR